MGKLFWIIYLGPRSSYKGGWGVRVREGDVMTKEVGVMHSEDEGRGQEPRNVGRLYKLEKVRKWILP